MNKHSFCRVLYNTTMKEVKAKCSKETIASAWAYNYHTGDVEFHINSCPEVPDGYFWFDKGCCLYVAKANGWRSFLDEMEVGR